MTTTPTQSRARRIVLAALAEVPESYIAPGRQWVGRYGGSDSLYSRMDKIDTAELRASGGRNRMQHRHVSRAIQALIAEGLVEHKDGEHDDLYRLTPDGEEAVRS